MGQGVVIADGPPGEVLGGRLAFRDRGGAGPRRRGRCAHARRGAARADCCRPRERSARDLAGRLARPSRRRARRRLRLVRALAAARERDRGRGRAGGARGGRAARVRRVPERQAHHRHRPLRRLRARSGARASRSERSPRSCRTSSSRRGRGPSGRWPDGGRWASPGAVLARTLRGREPNRFVLAGGMRTRRPGVRRVDGRVSMDTRRPTGPRYLCGCGRDLSAVQHRPRRRATSCSAS